MHVEGSQYMLERRVRGPLVRGLAEVSLVKVVYSDIRKFSEQTAVPLSH